MNTPPASPREAAVARLTAAYESNNIPVDRFALRCINRKAVHEIEALADHWEARKAQADKEAKVDGSSPPHEDDLHVLALGTTGMARRIGKLSTFGRKPNQNVGRTYRGTRLYHGQTSPARSAT